MNNLGDNSFPGTHWMMSMGFIQLIVGLFAKININYEINYMLN